VAPRLALAYSNAYSNEMIARVVLSLLTVLPLWAASSEDTKFAAVAKDFFEKMLEHSPEMATAFGDHRFDGRLTDWSDGRKRFVDLHRECVQALSRIDRSKLMPVNRVDYDILRTRAEAQIWLQTVLREHEWNPIIYNPGGAIYLLLEREFAPLPARLEAVRKRLEAIPAFLVAAKGNLRVASKVHTETALQQNKGTIRLVRDLLNGYTSKAPEALPGIQAAQAKAIAALQDWDKVLTSDVLPRANRDFRIGSEFYQAKLRYVLDSALTTDEIRRRAERDLKETQSAMYDAAAGLYAKMFPGKTDLSDQKGVIRAVLDKLAEDRPDASTIMERSRRELADATAFVRSKNLLTIYDTPLEILEMPEFQRGVAVANCVSPGPLERNGKTFYNISPPPANWTPEQVASYFREYNDYMLKNLTVHETMPGHYAQIGHSNRFQSPTLTRAIFRSGVFVEGWAVYAEQLMAENGYGGPEVKMQQLKMRLRTIINALIDAAIHTRGMTESEAMNLMMNDGFQEHSEAAGKWRRAQLTSVQLSTYYVGSTELLELRDDYRRKFGAIRDQRAFHDKLLSFGSVAPHRLRGLMGL
jgi:uncharacterized protein (DUF885 family)